MPSNATYFVYEHWRPDIDACFYVGKGMHRRVRSVARKENQRHCRIVAKLKSMGLSVEVRIFAEVQTEKEAFDIEVIRIKHLRDSGVDIVNMTDGGEGASGVVVTDEMRRKRSELMLGKAGAWLKGRKLSEEHKAKISASGVGRKVSEETRKKISDAQKGKPRPELIGRVCSEETREKHRNRVFTDEHRRRISEAKKGVSRVKKQNIDAAKEPQ